MSDIDKELRQLIKDEFGRSLKGWTFTPAMREAVLDRIAREGEPEATPATSPLKRFRPAYWVAAAAAAFVLAINLWPWVSTDQLSTGSARGAGSVAAPESAQLDTASAPGAADQAGALKILAAPMDSGAGVSGRRDDGASTVSGSAQQEDYANTALTLKVHLSDAELPALTEEARSAWISFHLKDASGAQRAQVHADQAGSQGPGEGASQAPGEDASQAPAGETGAVRVMGVTPPAMIDLNLLADGNVVIFRSSSVQVINAYGNLVSETPLEQAPAAVVAGPAGESAVVTEGVVLRFTAEGRPAGSLRAAGLPAAVAVSGDRTAIANADGIEVYDADERVLTLSGLQLHAMALAPDGALALLTRSSGESRMLLYAADGQLLLDQPVAPDGEAFGFLGDGQRVAVGSAVYDRTGRYLWGFPLAPARVSTLAGGRGVLAWNPQQVAWVEAGSGTPLWLAEVQGGSILQVSGSDRGDLAVILIAGSDGPAVWILDESGARRHAERLSDWPVDAAASGDQLMLLTAEGLKVRSLSR